MHSHVHTFIYNSRNVSNYKNTDTHPQQKKKKAKLLQHTVEANSLKSTILLSLAYDWDSRLPCFFACFFVKYLSKDLK